ncbi:MAG: D-glycerate dehydrogenase [Pirellulaceae bacterium]|jgi:glyoxylate reductase|nr:D-glycerate dehydrogenase [Pirellulaceae bacterium]MDP7020474.1 D-glycerate dehydrogenase [Pirellulaceae bacterium]
MTDSLPRVVADGPLAENITGPLAGRVELLPWQVGLDGSAETVDAIYTYGHPTVDGPMMDRLPGLRVISNYGVGVDHIDVAAATARGLPVGNTPTILNGATADMAFALLLAAGRRLAAGDRYARSAEFTVYDPGYMLGREIHHATLGIVGMGGIGQQIARRARGFDMKVLYHNRNRRTQAEEVLQASYVSFDRLLTSSDYVVVSTPLTEETRGLIGARELELMKETATLVNIARGPVVDTDALTAALQSRSIYAAGVDVTDPEPLPRDHPLLGLDNFTVAPHLGSATVETRGQMADLSIQNLLAGLADQPLVHRVLT